MNVKEAIKLVVTLHTPLPKLQTAIIRDDMTFDQMMKMAQSMELAQREITYMNHTAMVLTQTYNTQDTMDLNQLNRHTDRQGRPTTTAHHMQRKPRTYKTNKDGRIMQILWGNRTTQRQLQGKRSHMPQLWKNEPLCKSMWKCKTRTCKSTFHHNASKSATHTNTTLSIWGPTDSSGCNFQCWHKRHTAIPIHICQRYHSPL